MDGKERRIGCLPGRMAEWQAGRARKDVCHEGEGGCNMAKEIDDNDAGDGRKSSEQTREIEQIRAPKYDFKTANSSLGASNFVSYMPIFSSFPDGTNPQDLGFITANDFCLKIEACYCSLPAKLYSMLK